LFYPKKNPPLPAVAINAQIHEHIKDYRQVAMLVAMTAIRSRQEHQS